MIKKISIIGAGAVGSTLAFTVLERIPPQTLVLIDIAVGLAKGIALDLEDTRGHLNFTTALIGTNSYQELKDSDIIILTAGAARREGMTRADLIKINATVAREASQKIKELAPAAIVIVITNPLDVITYIVSQETGFDRKRILGMGSSLDTSRLKNILHLATGASTLSLEALVYGIHSKDMIVSDARIKIEGKSIHSKLKDNELKLALSAVQLRGAEIVGHLKTKSAHFAPAVSCCSLLEAIINDKNEIIPVSVLLKGEYGLSGICMGVPCTINRNGADKIIELELTATEKEEVKKAKELFSQCMMSQ